MAWDREVDQLQGLLLPDQVASEGGLGASSASRLRQLCLKTTELCSCPFIDERGPPIFLHLSLILNALRIFCSVLSLGASSDFEPETAHFVRKLLNCVQILPALRRTRLLSPLIHLHHRLLLLILLPGGIRARPLQFLVFHRGN